MEAEGLEFVEDGEVQLRFVRDLDRGHVWQAVLNTIRKVRRVTRNKESEREREERERLGGRCQEGEVCESVRDLDGGYV